MGSWRSGVWSTEIFPSRRHGGSRRKMEVLLCFLSDDLGVEMLQIEEHSQSLWLLTMVTIWWSMTLASLLSDFSTSMWRPFLKLASATLVPPIPSGLVPGAGADGRGGSLLFIGGGRGPNCVSNLLFRVYHVISWDAVVIFLLLKVPSVNVPAPQ